MASPKHPGEVPDTCEELAAILERQKARGKDEPVKFPAVTYTTSIEGDEVEKGALPCED